MKLFSSNWTRTNYYTKISILCFSSILTKYLFWKCKFFYKNVRSLLSFWILCFMVQGIWVMRFAAVGTADDNSTFSCKFPNFFPKPDTGKWSQRPRRMVFRETRDGAIRATITCTPCEVRCLFIPATNKATCYVLRQISNEPALASFPLVTNRMLWFWVTCWM